MSLIGWLFTYTYLSSLDNSWVFYSDLEVAYVNWTPIVERCVVKCGSKNNTKEIGCHALNLLTMTIVDVIICNNHTRGRISTR